MMPLMEWLQSFGFAEYVRESALFYPIVLALHLTGIGVFGAMVALTDLRMLGVAMKGRSIADVHGQLRPYKHLGLTLIVTCGLILGWSKAAVYWPNPYFKTKLFLLLMVGVHAFAFRSSVYKNLDAIDRAPETPLNARVAALLSIALWVGLITCGRMIGYWEP